MNNIQNHKNKQGITMIALIITIIVLLILSGITISMISGNNSIINNSVKAKDETEIANEKEEIKREIVHSTNKYGTLIADELKNNINNNIADATASGDDFPILVEFEKTKHKYTINSEGELNKGD